MVPKQVFIIGGGVAGLATAWKLASSGWPVTVIEKDRTLGGLARTVAWDGWNFDLGPHNIHTHKDDIAAFYREFLGEEFLARTPIVRLYIFDKLVSYPFISADVLLSLKGLKMAQATLSFLFTRLKAFLFGIPNTPYLDDWIIRRFGRILYGTYFQHYIERVWKVDPHRLSKSVGEVRIPVLSIRNYIKKDLLKDRRIRHPEDLSQLQSYYVRHGIGHLSEKFAETITTMPNARIHLGEEALAFDCSGDGIRAIRTTAGTYDTRSAVVVSTIPLNLLLQEMLSTPPELRSTVSILEHCSERFLLMKVRKPKVTGYDWVYFSDRRYPFNRVAEFRRDHFEMVPVGHSSLTFEFPCNEGDWEWSVSDDSLVDAVLPLFNEVFSLKRDDILAYRSEFLKHAYPRYVVGYERVLKNISQFLGSIQNLYTIGRQGLFCYVNIDEATDMGFNTARSIMTSSSSADGQTALFRKFHRL
jgi:protoporphyrinogen oxidase